MTSSRCVPHGLTVVVALTKKLQEAEEVTREFIVRHHFLIWEHGQTSMNFPWRKPSLVLDVFRYFCCYSVNSRKYQSQRIRCVKTHITVPSVYFTYLEAVVQYIYITLAY